MAVEDIKTPYEVLIRYDKGVPRGAHAQYLRRVTIDGELIKEEIGDALPLDVDGFPTSAIMTDTARDALAEVTRLHMQIAAQQAQIADLTARLDALSG